MKQNKSKYRWIIYLAIVATNIGVYYVTEPDATYQPNINFQKFIAAEIGLLIVLSFIELVRDFDIGQIFKIVFWVGTLIYTLGDILIRYTRISRFPHFPEVLVACYVIAVILKERNSKEAASRSLN